MEADVSSPKAAVARFMKRDDGGVWIELCKSGWTQFLICLHARLYATRHRRLVEDVSVRYEQASVCLSLV